MTARKSTAKVDETDDNKVDTAGENKSEPLKTTADEQETKASNAASTDPGETDAEGAASGEVEGGVAYGDSGFEDDFLDTIEEGDDEFDGVVGTVREGDTDVPYMYLTAGDVEKGAKIRTSDSDDQGVVEWNVQTTLDDDETPVALVPKEQTPGQTFRVGELPNLEVMKAAGIDVPQFLSGLPIRADVEGEGPRRGIPA